ncbi:MAG: flagellar basal body L-ring protein FlgH [Paracoccaceae bacterium]
MHPTRLAAVLLLALSIAACGRLAGVGKAPAFSPVESGNEYYAMTSSPFDATGSAWGSSASLWSGQPDSLLGDRRAGARGDILTVVIEINDKAQISNTSARNRAGSERMGIPSLFGIPQRLGGLLPEGQSFDPAVSASSASSYQGSGTVQRQEQLTLRIAATVTETLPNGILRIEGTQEVRVNGELRELLVSGFVRPEDVSRQNEIAYDKIAGARISYGGRGQVSSAQSPRYGQEAVNAVLPF